MQDPRTPKASCPCDRPDWIPSDSIAALEPQIWQAAANVYGASWAHLRRRAAAARRAARGRAEGRGAEEDRR